MHPGDWAIIKVRGTVDMRRCASTRPTGMNSPSRSLRLGNDYSKGIILSTGYVGQRTTNGLGHLPDRRPSRRRQAAACSISSGDLVGIPVGRMQGDYRFSFILPVRAEMFRQVPGVLGKRRPIRRPNSWPCDGSVLTRRTLHAIHRGCARCASHTEPLNG